MRQALNYGWENELLSDNPFLRKPKIAQPHKHEQPVMDAAAASERARGLRGFRYEAAILLMAFCDLRREEACGMRWEDVQFDQGLAFAHVERTSKDDGLGESKTERSAHRGLRGVSRRAPARARGRGLAVRVRRACLRGHAQCG